jgi:hypothetical protein
MWLVGVTGMHVVFSGGLVAIMYDGCWSAVLNVTCHGEVKVASICVSPDSLFVELPFSSRLVILWPGAYCCFQAFFFFNTPTNHACDLRSETVGWFG